MAHNRFRDVLSAVETERERTIAERDAFRRFADGVLTIDQPTATVNTTFAEANTDRNALEAVQGRYRETVMATPHYAREYDEGLRENMAEELHQDAATAVVDGQSWSPHLQQLLVYRARVAARNRDELLATIDREKESITEIRSQLRTTATGIDGLADSRIDQRSFPALIEHYDELERRIRRCERLLTDRQRHIHRESEDSSRFDFHLQTFLYTSLETSFPVLCEILEGIRRLQERRTTVIRELTQRC